MRWKEIICVLAVGVAVGIGCGGEESAPASKLVEITTLTGEKMQIESARLCWNTMTPIPEGHVAVPHPALKRVDFVPVDAVGAYDYDYGGSGSISCDCTSGTGCDPAYLSGNYYCVMKEGCSACTKK